MNTILNTSDLANKYSSIMTKALELYLLTCKHHEEIKRNKPGYYVVPPVFIPDHSSEEVDLLYKIHNSIDLQSLVSN